MNLWRGAPASCRSRVSPSASAAALLRASMTHHSGARAAARTVVRSTSPVDVAHNHGFRKRPISRLPAKPRWTQISRCKPAPTQARPRTSSSTCSQAPSPGHPTLPGRAPPCMPLLLQSEPSTWPRRDFASCYTDGRVLHWVPCRSRSIRLLVRRYAAVAVFRPPACRKVKFGWRLTWPQECRFAAVLGFCE